MKISVSGKTVLEEVKGLMIGEQTVQTLVRGEKENFLRWWHTEWKVCTYWKDYSDRQ
mgnify:CR=1 FL=1